MPFRSALSRLFAGGPAARSSPAMSDVKSTPVGAAGASNLCALALSTIGPTGKAKVFQSSLDQSSSIELSASASRLFDANTTLNSISDPSLRVMVQVVSGHVSQTGDGGLFCAGLGSGLMEIVHRRTASDGGGHVSTVAGNEATATDESGGGGMHPTLVSAGFQLCQVWTNEWFTAAINAPPPGAVANSNSAAASAAFKVRQRLGVTCPVGLWRWNHMPSVLASVRSVLRPKRVVCRLTDARELDHLSVLIVQSFLTAIPTLPKSATTIASPAVRVSTVTGSSTLDSYVLDGVVVDCGMPSGCPVTSLVAPPRAKESESEFGEYRKPVGFGVVCYNVNLIFDAREQFSSDIPIYRVQQHTGSAVSPIASIDQKDVSTTAAVAPSLASWSTSTVAHGLMDALVASWVSHAVRVVFCQKLIDPYLKHACLSRGIIPVERLSIRHFESVQSVCGGKTLSSVEVKHVTSDAIGRLSRIKEQTIDNKTCLLISPSDPPHATATPLTTLILHGRDEHACSELVRVTQSALAGLRIALTQTHTIPPSQGGGSGVLCCAGSGVTEYLWSCQLRYRVATARATIQRQLLKSPTAGKAAGSNRSHKLAVLAVASDVADLIERVGVSIAVGGLPLHSVSAGLYSDVNRYFRRARARLQRVNAHHFPPPLPSQLKPTAKPATAAAAVSAVVSSAPFRSRQIHRFDAESSLDTGAATLFVAAPTDVKSTTASTARGSATTAAGSDDSDSDSESQSVAPTPNQFIGADHFKPIVFERATTAASASHLALTISTETVFDNLFIKRAAIASAFDTAAMLLRVDDVRRDMR